jgi:hypothetical protein
VLAYDDRTRIVSDADRARIIAPNGDTLPIILVDGVVAGRWWAVDDGGTTRTELEPFRRLARADRSALEELGHRLARFVERTSPTCLPDIDVGGRTTHDFARGPRSRAVDLATANAVAGQFPFAALVIADDGQGR